MVVVQHEVHHGHQAGNEVVEATRNRMMAEEIASRAGDMGEDSNTDSPSRLCIVEKEEEDPKEISGNSPAGSAQSATSSSDLSSCRQRGETNLGEAGQGMDMQMTVLSATTTNSPSPPTSKSSSYGSPAQYLSSSSTVSHKSSTQSMHSTLSMASASSLLSASSASTMLSNTSTSPSLSASSTSSSFSGSLMAAPLTLLRKHSAPPFPAPNSAISKASGMSVAGGGDASGEQPPRSPALSDSAQLAAKQSPGGSYTPSGLGVEKRHKCPVCDKAFPYLSILESHKRCHTGEKPFSCHFCDKAFAQKATLQVHERTHTGERPYKCKYCQKTFAQYGTKTVHEKSAHLGIRNYRCPKCNKCLSSPSALYTHKKTHGDKVYQCQFCPKQFTLKNYLKLHVKQVHEQNERKHLCPYCEKTFAYAGSLQVHVRTHTGERPYMCKYCPKAFASQGNLQSHERTHTGERPFVCQQCGRAFIQKSQLSAHEATHAYHHQSSRQQQSHHSRQQHSSSTASSDNGSTGIATLASAAASIAAQQQMEQLQQTVAGTHGAVEEMEVDVEGGDSATSARDRGEQMGYERKHSITEAQLADYSMSSYHHAHNTTNGQLASVGGKPNANSASGTNDFVCKYCGKRYAYASSLYVHTRLHTGERPFRCQYCAKEFTNQGNMQVHQRVHTGEKPYKCDSCGKCYAQKVGLKIHQEQCQPHLSSRRGSVATNASSTSTGSCGTSIGNEQGPLSVEPSPVASIWGGSGTEEALLAALMANERLQGMSTGTVMEDQRVQLQQVPMANNGMELLAGDESAALTQLLGSALGANSLQMLIAQKRQHIYSANELKRQQVVAPSITPQSSTSQPSSLFSSPIHSHRPSLSEILPLSATSASPVHAVHAALVNGSGEGSQLDSGQLLRHLVNQCTTTNAETNSVMPGGGGETLNNFIPQLASYLFKQQQQPHNLSTATSSNQGQNFENLLSPTGLHPALGALQNQQRGIGLGSGHVLDGMRVGSGSVPQLSNCTVPATAQSANAAGLQLLQQQSQQQQALLRLLEQAELQQRHQQEQKQHQQQQAYQLRQLTLLKSILDAEGHQPQLQQPAMASGEGSFPIELLALGSQVLSSANSNTIHQQPLPQQSAIPVVVSPVEHPPSGCLPRPQPLYLPGDNGLAALGSPPPTVTMHQQQQFGGVGAPAQLQQQLLQLLQAGLTQQATSPATATAVSSSSMHAQQ